MIRFLLTILLTTSCSVLAAPVKVLKEPVSVVQCGAWVIHDEARGESLKGARAVLDVVKERARLSGKTVCDVVKQPKQFSGYRKGQSFNVTAEQIERYWTVARMKPVVKGSTHFHATYVTPPWRKKMKLVKKVGRHIFYKEK